MKYRVGVADEADRPQRTVRSLPGFAPAPNISGDPATYETENESLDRSGVLWRALERAAPWQDRTLLDLGCGTGFWLPRYLAAGAAAVIGVEPDPALLRLARARCPGLPVLAGSAEHLLLPDASVDVVHARFAYFWGAGAEAGLAEARRVLRPGGALVAVDNDHDHGDFARLLAAAATGSTTRRQADVDAWWAAAGADRIPVSSSWDFDSRADLEAVLALEFPDGAANEWLTEHPGVTALSLRLPAVHRAHLNRRRTK